ncbi:MAG: acyl-CoA thioesterase [Lachnospiraceae bacterium]
MEKVKPYTHKVQYYETDAMGVVHHSNYIRWFEETRLDYMEQIQLPYQRVEERGILIPVLSASCEYRQAVKFPDTVIIETEITAFNGLKFTTIYRVFDKTHKILHASGTTQHCFLDQSFHPLRLKKQAPDIYEIFENCLSHE